MKNLTIIGTSHIAKQSLDEVTSTIEREKPDIIAIELDRRRLFALKTNKKRKLTFRDIRSIGIKGFLFNVIGAYIEKKLGKIVGVKPGSEMISAIKLAEKNKIKLALIDQDIAITLKRFSKTFTWKEKFNLARDLFRAVFFRKRELKRLGITDLDLSKVPSKKLIKKLLERVKTDYPNIYKVLIEERNHVMANNLRKLISQHPDKRILAIIGAGHKEGIEELLNNPDEQITYSFSVG